MLFPCHKVHKWHFLCGEYLCIVTVFIYESISRLLWIYTWIIITLLTKIWSILAWINDSIFCHSVLAEILNQIIVFPQNLKCVSWSALLRVSVMLTIYFSFSTIFFLTEKHNMHNFKGYLYQASKHTSINIPSQFILTLHLNYLKTNT